MNYQSQTSDFSYIEDESLADQLARELNEYSGDNFWQDVVCNYPLDDEAIESADPCGRSDIVILDDGGRVEHRESEGWVCVEAGGVEGI